METSYTSFCCTEPSDSDTLWFCSLFTQAWVNAMTMNNEMAGFRVCVFLYPFNRDALVIPEEQYKSLKLDELPQISGLKYIPMYFNPAPPRIRSSYSSVGSWQRVSMPIESSSSGLLEDSIPECTPLSRQHSFSESSLYGLSFDRTANVARTPNQTSMQLRRATSLSHFLIKSMPPSKLVTKQPKSCGWVLTSWENIQQLEEKKATLKEKKNKNCVWKAAAGSQKISCKNW